MEFVDVRIKACSTEGKGERMTKKQLTLGEFAHDFECKSILMAWILLGICDLTQAVVEGP